jgi:peptide chain release factor subunit 1
VIHLTKEQEKDRSNFVNKDTGTEMEIVEKMPLLEWFAEHYKEFGTTLEFVTNRSPEGSQFVKGFGGIGGLLRYKVDFEQLNYESDEDGFMSGALKSTW